IPDPAGPFSATPGPNYLLPRIRFRVVPHTGHLPRAAFRPFFMVTSSPSNSRFCLHLTQYASYLAIACTSRGHRPAPWGAGAPMDFEAAIEAASRSIVGAKEALGNH